MPGANYVAALTGAYRLGWLRESLCSDYHERDAIRDRGEPRLDRDPLARTVAIVVDRWESQCDG